MKMYRKFAMILVLFVIAISQQTFAAESDFFNGQTQGMNEMDGGQASTYWNAFLNNPNQATWDYYLGYVDGLSGGYTYDYPGTPFPTEYLMDSQAAQTTSYIMTQQGTNRLATNYRKLMRKPKIKTAADSVNNVSMTFDYSIARVDDNILGGSGFDNSGSLILNGMVGDNLMVAMAYSKSFYEIDAADWDQSTDSLDAYVTYQLFKSLNVGAFVSFNKTDIEDQRIGTITLDGTNFDRWGAGLLASTDIALCDHSNLGIIGTVASMNKKSIAALGDDEDTAGILMADLSIFPTDDLTLSTYASFLTMLDRESGPDGSYYTFGAECEWKVSQSTYLKFGYETTGSDNDHQEDRFNLGVIVAF